MLKSETARVKRASRPSQMGPLDTPVLKNCYQKGFSDIMRRRRRRSRVDV